MIVVQMMDQGVDFLQKLLDQKLLIDPVKDLICLFATYRSKMPRISSKVT
jgi:FixJ family two-component response regulator